MNGKCNIIQFIHVMIKKFYIYNLSLFRITTYAKKKIMKRTRNRREKRIKKEKKITPIKNVINNDPSELHLSPKDGG